MKLIRAFFMSMGMFSAIPCPYRPWDEDARDWMLVMLPVVGAVIGLCWMGIGMLGDRWLPMGMNALIVALPWLLTGFIHLDGYMDTCDAMLSWRPLEKRLAILKDSHTGAFAVVGLGLIMLFSYDAVMTMGMPRDLRPIVFVPIVSRCGSAFAVLTLKPIEHSQYTRTQGTLIQRAAVIFMWLLSVALCAVWLNRAVIALIVETLAYIAAMAWAYRGLQGVSGDLAGFALTVSECSALMALAQL